jgi:hypothetical protein
MNDKKAKQPSFDIVEVLFVYIENQSRHSFLLSQMLIQRKVPNLFNSVEAER